MKRRIKFFRDRKWVPVPSDLVLDQDIDELVLYHRRGHLAIFFRPCVGGEERSDL
jgi:hypothetical protein